MACYGYERIGIDPNSLEKMMKSKLCLVALLSFGFAGCAETAPAPAPAPVTPPPAAVAPAEPEQTPAAPAEGEKKPAEGATKPAEGTK